MGKVIDIGEIRITDRNGDSLVFVLYSRSDQTTNRIEAHIESIDESSNNYMIDKDIRIDLSVGEFLKEIDGLRNQLYKMLKESRG